MNEVFAFIDESGIFQKSSNPNHRYFIIAIVFTNDPAHLSKIFKRARLKAVSNDDELMERLRANSELKGSELKESQKAQIYHEIVKKCIMEFGIIVVDTLEISDAFKQNAARTFNYLLKIFFQNYSKSNNLYSEYDKVNLSIDERNVATKSLYTLKEYLNTELVMSKGLYKNDFEVHYDNSKSILLIQLSDYIANTVLRSFHGSDFSKYDASKNLKLLKPFLSGKELFFFANEDK